MTGGCVWGGCGAPVWAGWPSGSPGCRTAQRGALCRHDWPTVAQKQKSPPPASTGGGPGEGRRSMLLVDPVGTVTLVGFEGLHRDAHLLAEKAGYPTPRRVFLPSCQRYDLGHGRAALPFQQRDNLLTFGPGACGLRLLGRLRFLGHLCGFGRFLGRGGLLGRLALRRRALGGLCATLGLFPSLRLRGRCFGLRGFRFGLGSFAQALNPLPDPAGSRLGVLELLHRLLARKAIQNRYRRSTGHWAASSANSCSVLKLSNGVAVAAAASSAVANALIAFSWSIVKVVIIVLLGAALCAVIT